MCLQHTSGCVLGQLVRSPLLRLLTQSGSEGVLCSWDMTPSLASSTAITNPCIFKLIWTSQTEPLWAPKPFKSLTETSQKAILYLQSP